ncbi:MAG: hypothetical protein JNM31_09565 [Flavobacteriales bacterium]|nr:hypothetical protein [Flavobacteriales bacterium]
MRLPAITHTLTSEHLTRWLFGANMVVAALLCVGLRDTLSGDHPNYIALAEGLLNGRYSSFWFEPAYLPETFRTPGYPLYLSLFIGLTGGWRAVVVVQWFLYALCIGSALRVIERLGQGPLAKNIFLVLLLPSINLPYYAAMVLPELPALTALMLILAADPAWHKRSWLSALAIGLLYGFLFQCRPVYLLLPFARVALGWWLERPGFAWRWHGGMLLTYAASLLPFTLWNHAHHGVWKATPLEGGGGIFQIGYWSGLMPHHQEFRLWGNKTGDELIRFTPAEKVPAHIAAFEHEWDRIDSACAPYLTARDSAIYREHGRSGWVWNTFSTAYTLEREKWLWRSTLEQMKANPGYTLAWKAYSAVRLWVTGVQVTAFRQASLMGKLQQLYPFLLTLGQFLLAVWLIPWAALRVPGWWRSCAPLLLVVLYGWAIYIPFAIQSRYTIPVRMALFILLACAVVEWMRRHTRLSTSTS